MRVIHNLNPVFGHIGGVYLWYYGLAYALGFAGVFLWLDARRSRFGWSTRDVYRFSILFSACVLFFGRAFEVVVYELSYFRQHPGELLDYWQGGMASHGVMLGGLIAVAVFSHVKGTRFLEITDELAVPAAFFLGLGRIGNFINGQIYGSVTDAWWGIQFPGTDELRHPVTLYESMKNFALIPIILAVRRVPGRRPGMLSACFVFGYGSLRMFTDIFRDYGAHFMGIGRGQYFNALTAMAGLLMLLSVAHHDRDHTGGRASLAVSSLHDRANGLWLCRLAFLVLLVFSLTIPSSWGQGALRQIRGREAERSRVAALVLERKR